MDLAGSTDAKRRIRAIKPADVKLRQQHYKQLVKKLLIIEDRFYGQLFSPAPAIPAPLDPRRFFVVKTIGDEIWMLYEPEAMTDAHVMSAAMRLLDAALSVVNLPSDLVATSERDKPDFDPSDPLPEQVVSIPTEIKVFMDIISDCIDATSIRQRFLLPRLANYGRAAPSTATLFDSKDPEIVGFVNQLNLGYLREGRLMTRSDVIGFDVDKFFRTSKAAKPGIATVGNALFERLGLESSRVRGVRDVRSGSAMIPLNPANPPASKQRSQKLYFRREVLPRKDLKGIGSAYQVWHLASDLVVRSLHTKPRRRGVTAAQQLFPREIVYPRHER